jgi:very-short-patch-repair endonuclease
MSPRDAEEALARIARRQHGVWNRHQALNAGLTHRMVRIRVEAGRWLELDVGVYASRDAPATWHRQMMAAVLAEPWAVAARRSAAVLHRVPGFRPGTPTLLVPPGASTRSRLATVHRGTDAQTTVVDGIPCTTVAQTMVDLAQTVGEQRLRAAVAAVADRSPTDLDAVRDRYCELAPRGGRDLRRLRAVLTRFGAGDLPLESELESVLRRIVDGSEVPEVRWQASFPGRSPGSQRVDGFIDAWRLILEGDGRAWHTRVEDFDRDRRRDAEAAAAGLLTLRFTWHQLTHAPDWVLGIIVAAGRHRAVA